MSAPLGPRGSPAAPPDMPDLSHLTEEERKIILSVMDRQKKEEEKEQSMLKESPNEEPKPQPAQWNPLIGLSELVSNALQPQAKSPTGEDPKSKLHQQFEMYKDQVKKIGEETQKTQDQKSDSPTCGICHKTKFADGCGHVCSYCQTKFCARCGGRVSLRSNKVMWVCNLCRKQQEILTKSGAWFYGGAEGRRFGPQAKVRGSRAVDSKRSPSASRDPNAVYNQREGLGGLQHVPADPGMPRSPSDYGRDPGRSPRGSRMYEDPRWHSQDQHLDSQLDDYELQRRREEEEEYQARYRSDPNLARYPVKPQPYEEQMRIHAQVSRARHERRHSDVSLAYTELDEPLPGIGGRQSRPPLLGGPGQRSYSVDRSSPGPRMSNHSPPTPHRSPVLGEPARRPVPQPHHLDPSSALHRSKVGREKMDGMLRNDSLSSDQSESVRPPPPRPHRGRHRTGKLRAMGSFSSSEEELATTPEYTSCEDVELESESISEKGDMDGHWWDHASWHSEASPMSMHPVTWQPSKDGDRLIGRILLNKRMKDGTVPRDTGALLGLKVVGGKMTESGRLCAFITKVKRGSLADTVGHLRPGDQVLEWNGRVLQGATFKEVYNIILESKPEPQVELVVSRPIGDIPRIPESTHGQLESSSSSFESQKMGPAISVTSPMSPGMLRDAPQYLSGQLSVKLWYDKVGHQLIVTILGAKDLPAREDGRPRNPYVKIYFLPDRSDKSKRRTKTVKKSLEPKWNQTFMYSPVHRREFRERMLEITLWDQARVREEESEFLGEILIELETALLDDQPHWYKLQTHDLSSLPLPNPSPYMQRRLLQGESNTRRLQRSQRISDSEFSDYDCEDGIGVISDYRHNGRDFQSSTLSVPEQVMSSNHRSRSDMIRSRSRSPSVPPPQSRSLDHGVRGGPSQYSPRHQLSEDRYSPDSSGNPMYPIYREEALKLLRSAKMARTYSEGAYGSLDRRMRRDRRLSGYNDSYESPERHYNGPNHVPTPWPNHVMNGTCDDYRYSRGMEDRHYRSRSADQRAMMERPVYTRSRSSERPESGYMRSMPSLHSGRSAPPSPALTRANPRSGSVQTSPTSTPVSGRRGRQLPQVPPKGSMDRNGGEGVPEPYEVAGSVPLSAAPPPAPPPVTETAAAPPPPPIAHTVTGVELLAHALPLASAPVPNHISAPPAPAPAPAPPAPSPEPAPAPATVPASAPPPAPQPPVPGSLKDPSRRGMDSLSMKSSDSDVSDVSAMSSASRLSSASYMSVQSERARATRRISRGDALQQSQSQGEESAAAAGAAAEWGAGSAGGADGGGSGEAHGGSMEAPEEEAEEEPDRAQTATPGSNITKSSSVGGDMCSLGRNDDDEDDKKRRSSFGAKMAAMVGLGKKSQSTSQLDPEGKSSVLSKFLTGNVVGPVFCY
uniref:Regulating synaptic membrane exocytosis 2 n=1 Tax=Astyanax mexicanus TaxID=7994 RepID=A0A8B9K1Z3_ASTMX